MDSARATHSDQVELCTGHTCFSVHEDRPELPCPTRGDRVLGRAITTSKRLRGKVVGFTDGDCGKLVIVEFEEIGKMLVCPARLHDAYDGDGWQVFIGGALVA